MATITCPRCGSGELLETNSILAAYHVTQWRVDTNEQGARVPVPDDYSESEVFWETSEAVKDDPYQCAECYWEGAADQLRISEEV